MLMQNKTYFDFWITMKKKNDFFEKLGERIVARRKDLGITQTELGDMINVSQQVITSYETAKRQVPASRFPILAKALGISIEDLMGTDSQVMKRRGPAPKIQKQLEMIQRLPKDKQKVVTQMLDMALKSA